MDMKCFCRGCAWMGDGIPDERTPAVAGDHLTECAGPVIGVTEDGTPRRIGGGAARQRDGRGRFLPAE